MKKALLAALLFALGACGNLTGDDGGEGLAAVQPSRIAASDLRAAASEPQLVRFYEARAWQPAWTRDNAAALVEAISGAPRHALDPDAFLEPVARAEEPAAREAALSRVALSYADALARGRVDPKRLRSTYSVPRPDPDLGRGLNQALEQGDIAGWIEGLAPQDEEYRRLAEAYAAAVGQARAPQTPIPDGPAVRPGRPDPRLPAIAAALRAQGYLPPLEREEGTREQAQPAPQIRSEELSAAIRALQEDYGLEPTGVIGAETVAALNRSAFDRARTLAVNLERRRWLPRAAAPTRIDVNIPGAFLNYWRGGRVVDRRRTVVGQPGDETPEMVSPLFRLVANPTWTVPRSIEEEEIAPKGEDYLRRNDMVRRDGWIVQLSGPDNALGLVKFDLRNDLAIYLHDTPAKTLFARDRRQFSHGCVRVQDALGLAEMIARQEGVTDAWREALATGEERFVDLPRAITVRLLYHSAFLEDGRIRYRPDPYGLDDDVAQALGLAVRPRPERPAHISDIGP